MRVIYTKMCMRKHIVIWPMRARTTPHPIKQKLAFVRAALSPMPY